VVGKSAPGATNGGSVDLTRPVTAQGGTTDDGRCAQQNQLSHSENPTERENRRRGRRGAASATSSEQMRILLRPATGVTQRTNNTVDAQGRCEREQRLRASPATCYRRRIAPTMRPEAASERQGGDTARYHQNRRDCARLMPAARGGGGGWPVA
jgi:hypothetical protein